MTINIAAHICLLSPLLGAAVARLLSGCRLATLSTVGSITLSLASAIYLFYQIGFVPGSTDLYEYTWLSVGRYQFTFGLWLDALSVLMLLIVTSVSWLVHIYSIGYMSGENNQGAYFSYVSFFTFSMLLLVMGNNLLQLFFGWEGVGVASYLLIGFWQTKAYPAKASIKAFVINRIGDIGLLIAIGLILMQLGDISYQGILMKGPSMVSETLLGYRLIDWVCLGLLIGAMGKSAQMPLHVWLPDSMAGPTPISALIHAATMVTAGIYLICRFAAWFELSLSILSAIQIIGFSTMLLMGIVAIVEYDIKKIIAYSTLSQLGMMIGICGASGYVFSIYHLATHAAFKALLFLAAGAVIIAENHEQDIRKLHGMRQFQSIHLSMIVGLISMIALPPTSGFFSKDAMLLLVSNNSLLYSVLLCGAVITTIYSVRLYYMLFWHSNKTVVLTPLPMTVKLPLLVLVLASLSIGYFLIPLIPVISEIMPYNQEVVEVLKSLSDPINMVDHALSSGALTIVTLSMLLSFYVFYKKSSLIDKIANRLGILYQLLTIQYGFNYIYENYLVNGYQLVSVWLWKNIDHYLIDSAVVQGVPRKLVSISKVVRLVANGKLYDYILIMLLAIIVILIGVL